MGCVYLTLLLVINVYILNAHEYRDHSYSSREAGMEEGNAEGFAEMNEDTDILHRKRRDTNQTKEELKPTTETQLKSKKKEDQVKSEKVERSKMNKTEEQLTLNKTEEHLRGKKFEDLKAKIDEVIKEKDKAKLNEQNAKKEAELKAKKEEEIQAKMKVALKRNKFFLNPRKEKELRNKIDGVKEEKEKPKKEKKVEPKKEDLNTNKTKAEVKVNQTDPHKYSWSTIKLLSQGHPNSQLKFRSALEDQMQNLKEQGDLVNWEKLAAKFRKAYDVQDAFHKKLSEASKKKQRIHLTPVEMEHYTFIGKMKEYARIMNEKGLPERVSINRTADKFLEYWFKYVEETESSETETSTVTKQETSTIPKG
uniref:Uncharacterized protein n=2 Tax=Cacopsylla melanoneura TaxID=428564 RepID=A0A8D8SM37_9HEMI